VGGSNGYLDFSGIRGLGAFGCFAVLMLSDMVRIDTTYDNDLLTSSREGEIEAAAERHTL